MMTPDFAHFEEGVFAMGAADAPYHEDGEGPVRPVFLSAFTIAACTVTNAQFREFVDATGHVSTAEARRSSHVFHLHLANPVDHRAPLADAPWWRDVRGACWQHPDGTGDAHPDHPVVHVSWFDARAYCAWSNTRLPTEAEWERAAQGGEGASLNIWEGDFPDRPNHSPGTRAVRDGAPNEAGMFHSCGNVWEWTADGFGRLHSPRAARNPTGNLGGRDAVVKGGSYLCAPSYCARFRPSSRRAEARDATTGHLGFRVVKNV